MTMSSNECEPRSEDLRLAFGFIADPQARADVLVLFALLEALRDIPGRVSEPLIGEIRLRWWYEAFEEIRDGRPVRYHPLTEAIQRLIGQYGLDPQDLMDMVEGQMPILDRTLNLRDAVKVVDAGEGAITGLAARMLDKTAQAEAVAKSARLAGLVSLVGNSLLPMADLGPEEFAHLLRDARTEAKSLSSTLMPLALPAVAARARWEGKAANPLTLRLKLFWGFVTSRI